MLGGTRPQILRIRAARKWTNQIQVAREPTGKGQWSRPGVRDRPGWRTVDRGKMRLKRERLWIISRAGTGAPGPNYAARKSTLLSINTGWPLGPERQSGASISTAEPYMPTFRATLLVGPGSCEAVSVPPSPLDMQATGETLEHTEDLGNTGCQPGPGSGFHDRFGQLEAVFGRRIRIQPPSDERSCPQTS